MSKHRITIRNYHLVNTVTNEKITVLPPPLRGLNRDNKNDKDSEGRPFRNFFVVDSLGVDAFKDIKDVILTNYEADALPYTVIDGVKWQLTAIEGVHAARPRTKKVEIQTVADSAPATENSAADVTATPVQTVVEASTSTEVATASSEAL